MKVNDFIYLIQFVVIVFILATNITSLNIRTKICNTALALSVSKKVEQTFIENHEENIHLANARKISSDRKLRNFNRHQSLNMNRNMTSAKLTSSKKIREKRINSKPELRINNNNSSRLDPLFQNSDLLESQDIKTLLAEDLTDDDFDHDFKSKQYNSILELDKDLQRLFNFTKFDITKLLQNEDYVRHNDNITYLVNDTLFCYYIDTQPGVRLQGQKSKELSTSKLRNSVNDRQSRERQRIKVTLFHKKLDLNRLVDSNSTNSSHDYTNKSLSTANATITSSDNSTSNDTFIDKDMPNLPGSQLVTNVSKIINDTHYDPNLHTLEQKQEICGNCMNLEDMINRMTQEVLRVKKNIALTMQRKPNNQLFLYKFSSWVMRVNLLKSDIFKVNELMNILNTANCPNQESNTRMLLMISNASDHLVELIQNASKTQNIDLNFVVLT